MAGITFAPPQQGNRLKLNDKNELVQATTAAPPRPDLTARTTAAVTPAAAPAAARVAAPAPAAAPNLAARAEQALGAAPATPFFTNRADVAAEKGLGEVRGVVGNQQIFGNRQLGTPGESGQVGGFVQAGPKPDSEQNAYAELGTGKLGAYTRSLLQNQDRVRKFKAESATDLETAQSAREDTRQAAINKRADERLAFDREKELASEIEKRFTSVDPNTEKQVVDYAAAAELKDYIGRTKETDVGKAITGLQKEKALTVAKQYGDAKGLEQAINAEPDAARKARLQQLYAAAYGA